MPTGNIALDAEDLEEKTWPLNEKANQRGSVVPLPPSNSKNSTLPQHRNCSQVDLFGLMLAR